MTPVWRRPLLIPVALILFGALLLATNLGAVPPDTWRWLPHLWPIVLILLGLELILTGRASWGAAAFLAIVVFLIAGIGVGRGAFGPGGAPRFFQTAPVRSAALDQRLDGAREAEVTISFGAGRLVVSSGASDGYLSQGNATGDPGEIRNSYRVRDGVGSLAIRTGDRFRFLGPTGPREARIQLTNAVPIRRLGLRTGASEVEANLGDLQVIDLVLQTGASRATVTLPARGKVSADIQAGASSIVLHVPPSMAADIRVDGGISGIDVDHSRFPPVSSTGVPGLGFQAAYRTPSFDSAQDRVTLRIQSGAGSVEVR